MTDSPHWYSSGVVESENDQHVVDFPSCPEALLVRHLRRKKAEKEPNVNDENSGN